MPDLGAAAGAGTPDVGIPDVDVGSPDGRPILEPGAFRPEGLGKLIGSGCLSCLSKLAGGGFSWFTDLQNKSFTCNQMNSTVMHKAENIHLTAVQQGNWKGEKL